MWWWAGETRSSDGQKEAQMLGGEGQCNYGKQAFQSANNSSNSGGNNSDDYNGIF